MSVDESTDLLKAWLLIQFGNREKISEFLMILINICDRTNGKMNAIYIDGEAGCGKSLFFQG